MDEPVHNLSSDSVNHPGFRFSLHTLLIATAVFALIIKTEGFGLVGFHYPRWIDNEPLNNPVKVVSMTQKELHLEDGRIVAITWRPDVLKDAIHESGDLIELATDNKSAEGMIYVKRRFTRCGTPWVRLINFRWFPDEIPSYYRYPLERATIIASAE
jgi:hypothetical protein